MQNETARLLRAIANLLDSGASPLVLGSPECPEVPESGQEGEEVPSVVQDGTPELRGKCHLASVVEHPNGRKVCLACLEPCEATTEDEAVSIEPTPTEKRKPGAFQFSKKGTMGHECCGSKGFRHRAGCPNASMSRSATEGI